MNLEKQKLLKIIISMKIILIPSIWLIFSNLLLAGNFTVIKEPKATFIEKNYVMLKKANKIEDTIDQDDFLAFPEALTGTFGTVTFFVIIQVPEFILSPSAIETGSIFL
jgi:hypothetical protein